MKMDNENDKKFMSSVSPNYIDKKDTLWHMTWPMIKIYTKYSSQESKSKYFEKVRAATDIPMKAKKNDISMFECDYSVFLEHV